MIDIKKKVKHSGEVMRAQICSGEVGHCRGEASRALCSGIGKPRASHEKNLSHEFLQNKYTFKNYDEKNSIELLCGEIKIALNNKMYFAALMMALAIPDVLGNLEYKNDKKYYAKWYDEYVRDCMGITYNERKQHLHRDSKDPNIFDGTQCYNLRCSLFHSAGIVNAAELYVKVNKEKIDKLDKIKINQRGGIAPRSLFMRFGDE